MNLCAADLSHTGFDCIVELRLFGAAFKCVYPPFCVCVCVCYSRDSDLSTIISNLHHTRQHGMPEGQSASDHNTSTGHTGRTPSDAACVFKGSPACGLFLFSASLFSFPFRLKICLPFTSPRVNISLSTSFTLICLIWGNLT